MKSSIKDLETKGFYVLPYPPAVRACVVKAAKAWKLFYALPAEVKAKLPYSNGGAGVGYERKDGVGKNADRKENFDVTSEGLAWLEANNVQTTEPALHDLVTNTMSLLEAVRPTILEFARESELEFGIKSFEEEISASTSTFFTRFIHYSADREVGEETAVSHVDQSGFTLHLYENKKGLRCLTYDGKWIDMPVSEGETVIIPDMQMQLRSNGRLRALCHQVVATEETAKSPRDSAVLFVQFKNTRKYDKERCGRLQERTPGFNYNMPIGEFEKMFK
jgi:isopenicillin N synthase-like dioxygenase